MDGYWCPRRRHRGHVAIRRAGRSLSYHLSGNDPRWHHRPEVYGHALSSAYVHRPCRPGNVFPAPGRLAVAFVSYSDLMRHPRRSARVRRIGRAHSSEMRQKTFYGRLLVLFASRLDDIACGLRFRTKPREIILERVENAEREACPDRRTEIKRHPSNFVLPLGKIVRYDPMRARVAESLKRPQKLAATRKLPLPSTQVHRNIDGQKKGEIACNPDDRGGEDQANRPTEVRDHSAEAKPNDGEGKAPYRIFDRIPQITGGQHCVP